MVIELLLLGILFLQLELLFYGSVVTAKQTVLIDYG